MPRPSKQSEPAAAPGTDPPAAEAAEVVPVEVRLLGISPMVGTPRPQAHRPPHSHCRPALCGAVAVISDGQIAQLCGHWAEQGVAGADWPALAAQVRTLAALRSDSEDPAQLAPLVDQLAALHARAKEALAAAVTQPSEPVETDP